ncbi:MAG: hypothetical protein LQ345_003662 [Seirophora villosa]|nr:MAG: hypothetical protein LQ345_003662 [Seirophora villosa]
MSEPIPESIPTSADPRSRRPIKRRALTPVSAQASQVDALFAKPDAAIPLPSTGTSKKSTLAPPPEIVANVQGSSAGAGSGEFHVYKASRRREYERVKQMEEENSREKADREYEAKKEEMRRKDEEKTKKNQRRREKLKARKGKGGKGDVEMGDGEGEEGKNGGAGAGVGKKRLGPAKILRNGVDDGEEGIGDEMVAKGVEDVGVVIHDDD